MSRRRLTVVAAAVVLLAVLAYFYGGHSVPSGQTALVALNASNLDDLKDEFNASASQPRLLVLLSPT